MTKDRKVPKDKWICLERVITPKDDRTDCIIIENAYIKPEKRESEQK